MESYRWVVGGWWWVYLDYSVSSGPFLRFTMSFEFLSEMFDHSVCEIRDPSLTIASQVTSSRATWLGIPNMICQPDMEIEPIYHI